MSKNEKMAVAVSKPTQMTATKAEARKLNGKRADKQDPKQEIGLAAQVAGITTYVKNWRIPHAQKNFPYDPLMRTVDKYFQYAKGGPLYIDEPTNPADVWVTARNIHSSYGGGLGPSIPP